MENANSQRGVETEIIEVIANLIASFSHHYELYNSIETDLMDSDQFPAEEVEKMQEESNYHYYEMLKLTEQRRSAMRLLRDLWPNPNNQWHCIVKHAIASYQFTQELLATDFENEDYIKLAEMASQYMYSCVSKYLWIDIVTCGRCMKDILDELK